jgi:hypothetical protein
MNLKELDSFKMSDAVVLHDTLNPALFADEHMRSDVRAKLLEIAEEFIDYLGVSNLDVRDITISGSNAAYSYTPHSDIDLHIIADMTKFNNDNIYRELFTAKKNLFNADHNIKVKGYDVELYVQDSSKPVRSLGEYSVEHNKWIKFPSKKRANLDHSSVENKFKKLVQLGQLALRSTDMNALSDVLSTLKRYRQAGLDEHGEFGPENLAYKALRSQGIVDKLYNHMDMLKDRQLSLDETIDEAFDKPYKSKWTKSDTGTQYSRVKLPDGTPLDVVFYNMGDNKYTVEFVRSHSMGVTGGGDAQRIFSTILNSVLQFVKKQKPQRLEFSASKDIYQADSPGVKSNPNSRSKLYTRMVNRYAEPLGYKVQYKEEKDYVEYVLTRLNQDVDEDYSVDNPPGPEFPPQFPAGTVKVDVSDVYDWYKLGQHISDLEGLGHHDFGQGPPSTVLAFGTEEEEEKYIKNLKKLGLKIHDIDPPGLKGDIDETRLFEEFQQFMGEASGYIPSEKEKNDPRFKTALTVDVHPDSIQQNAKKLGSKIARSGVPPTLKPSGKL